MEFPDRTNPKVPQSPTQTHPTAADGLEPVQQLQQRKAAEFVEADRLARQYLEREFMSRHEVAQCGLPADQEETREGRGLVAPAVAGCQTEGTVDRFIVQVQQHLITAILLDALTQTLAFYGIEVSEGGARDDLR
jgi:hypothetical protein